MMTVPRLQMQYVQLLTIKLAKSGLTPEFAVLDARATVSLLASSPAKMTDSKMSEDLARLEDKLGIVSGERWRPNCQEYKDALQQLVTEKVSG